MVNRGILQLLVETGERRGGGFLLLLDPDRVSARAYLELAEAAQECGVDGILVGSSLVLDGDFPDAVRVIREKTQLPVIIFPGCKNQVCPDADAILFTSLISGRNPEYLIDQQVRAAPMIRRYGLEPIPTGYMLIESGHLTSVQYMSATLPIPHNKSDIACAHALAAQYLGMKTVYLEAGSGAGQPVPRDMVAAVASYVEIPIIVGGGIRTPETCREMIAAGASFVVVGTGVEKDPDFSYLRDLTTATHCKESLTV